jgi:pimeloyl-ACP methyl ester carboxylesterase
MTPVRSFLAAFLPALAAGVLLCAGCSEVYVRRMYTSPLTESWRSSVIDCCELSPRSRQTLRRYDLDHLYPGSLPELCASLHAEALRDPRPELLFALSEVSYLRGRRAEFKESADASVFYYLCAGYAYHYLFDEYPPAAEGTAAASRSFPTGEAFDPRFRVACDLYNAGLAKCIVAAQQVGKLDPRQRLVLPARDGRRGITLAVVHHGFVYKPEEFGPVELCSDFQVVGLSNQHRTYGLGVPLIGSRAADASHPSHPYYPEKINFPITAFLSFQGSLADLAERRAGQLELFNPLTVQSLVVAGSSSHPSRSVPLETDLTTPLACYLASTPLAGAGYTGFLKPDWLGKAVGLHSLEPYQPGKIPVIMVHGLLASPMTWAPMFNDLQADPVLRKRFQFWVYFYPTGNPFLATAGELRRDLARMRQALDPEGKDPALDDMVFVGHSMGGLISRLMTIDGGNDFWKTVFPQEPFERVSLQPGTRDELRNTFFFERQRFVTRAIYLATPHHGSNLSPSVAGRLAARLAGLPRDIVAVSQDLAQENPDLAVAIRKHSLPTSVDELAPEAPALQLISHRPRPKEVHYHSVIGVTSRTHLVVERLFGNGYSQPSDGVVPYTSAHLDDVESELVVPADHYRVHHHPLAILEVRRILLEHVREYDKRQPIQQVQARTVQR